MKVKKSNLTKIRESRNLSQAEVARTLQISDTGLYYYEIGKRKVPLEIAKKLADLYKVNMEEIFLPETFSIR